MNIHKQLQSLGNLNNLFKPSNFTMLFEGFKYFIEAYQ